MVLCFETRLGCWGQQAIRVQGRQVAGRLELPLQSVLLAFRIWVARSHRGRQWTHLQYTDFQFLFKGFFERPTGEGENDE